MTSRRTDNGDHTGTLVVAFASGLAVGAALGVMLAPTPGRDTRGWIAERGRTARRGITPLLHPQEAMAVIRERGVRGLLDAMAKAAEATGDKGAEVIRMPARRPDGRILPN